MLFIYTVSDYHFHSIHSRIKRSIVDSV